MQLSDIDIGALPADECATDLLISAMAVLKNAIKDRAQAELKAIKDRETAILALLNGDAPPMTEEPKARAPGKPKYRHPDNPDTTWTGRGKKPEWMQTWIADGKDPNDLLIPAVC